MRSARAAFPFVRGNFITERFSSVPSTCIRGTFFSSSVARGHLDGDGSVSYRETLMFGRPGVMKCLPCAVSNASFIGTVVSPVHNVTDGSGISRVCSKLRVPGFQRRRIQPFLIFVNFLDDLAEIARKHLGLGDFVYVSGRLTCFGMKKDDESGNISVLYKVTVKDFNFVRKRLQDISQDLDKFELQEARMAHLVSSDPSCVTQQVDPSHLWQLYFASPHEWWDNRQNKRHPKAPDFVHKDTRESLWIQPTDPPWVKTHLELLDSRRGELRLSSLRRKHDLDVWELDSPSRHCLVRLN